MNFDDEPLAVQMARAVAEVGKARLRVDSLRGQVARREAGASSLTTAEWQLQQALRRVDELRSQADYGPPLDAA